MAKAAAVRLEVSARLFVARRLRPGVGPGGGGGTQTEGGAAGNAGQISQGSPGTVGFGGAGGTGQLGGGGGGGGFFGGGGGSGTSSANETGSGGGGSGHLDASVTGGAMTTGINDGPGLVTLTYRVTTTTGLVSSVNPSRLGQPLTLTAVVTGSHPTGNVTFQDGGTAIPGCASVALGSRGAPPDSAQCPAGALLPGTHSITAAYTGDDANTPSSSATLSQVINTGASASGAGGGASSSSGSGAASAPPPGLGVIASPSKAFSFARVRVSARALRISFDYPGRGTLDALVTTRRPGAESARLRPGPHRVNVGKLHDSADGAQTKTLVIPLTRRGRSLLARRDKLPIRLSLVFTPDGGPSARQAHKYIVRRR